MIRSISRMPRCHERNSRRLRRASSPLEDFVLPVIVQRQKPRLMPGAVSIARGAGTVSHPRPFCPHGGWAFTRRTPAHMVTRLLASPVLIVSAFAASVLAVQYRGRV